jgi:hypothetical protein
MRAALHVRAFVALLLSAVLAAGCARTVPGARGPLFGLDVGWVVSDAGDVLMTPGVARQVAATGADLARVEFRTTPFQAGTACFFAQAAVCAQAREAAWRLTFQAYDQVVSNLAAAHVQVLGLLDYTTVSGTQADWTADNAEHGLGTGANPFTEEFAATAERIMAHYAGRVRLWEIWNEPNAWTRSGPDGTYSGGTFMYPSNYAALLEAVYHDAVVVHHLRVTLISGGVFGHSIGGIYSPQNAGATYLAQVFAAWKREGIRRAPLDGVGQHLYISQGGAVTAAEVEEYLGFVHGVALRATGRDIPTYVTEMGWKRGPVSPAAQAENLRVALAAARAEPYVRAVVVFNYRGLGYGLYSAAGAPEPALAAFRAAVTAHGGR